MINEMPRSTLHLQMFGKEKYPATIPWHATASLQGTRRALFDSDELTCLYAFRHRRHECGAVTSAAMAGLKIDLCGRSMLMMDSELGAEAPSSVTEALANSLNASFS